MALVTSSFVGLVPVLNQVRYTFNELLSDNNNGNINNVKKVAIIIPYEIEIAIGIKNCAERLFSNINGANPAIVVNDVKKMALNRDLPACIKASSYFNPSFNLLWDKFPAVCRDKNLTEV